MSCSKGTNAFTNLCGVESYNADVNVSSTLLKEPRQMVSIRNLYGRTTMMVLALFSARMRAVAGTIQAITTAARQK
jgi:hypothetical protein